MIQSEAVDRLSRALRDFLDCARSFRAEAIHAVATGVVREAANRQWFLSRIGEETGLQIRTLTGEEEARLTGVGVLHALKLQERGYIIFDLGGGSTEFLAHLNGPPVFQSIPLGALVLKQEYLGSDPPLKGQIMALSGHIDRLLEGSGMRDAGSVSGTLVGTGGTVTTLAAMVKGVPVEEIDPERLNGVGLERTEIEALFVELTALRAQERVGLPGLDPERADVIPAGALIVMRIMDHLGLSRLRVCLSDLLDGILITYFEGEKDGSRQH